MCTNIIIDTNAFSLFGTSKLDKVRKWIEREHFILVYTNDQSSKFFEEIQGTEKGRNYVLNLRRSNSLKLLSHESIEEHSHHFDNKPLKSGVKDRPILELALAGKVEVICTIDKKLKEDFLNIDILPSVMRGRQRAVYPHKTSESNQNKFLNRWKCP